MGLYLGLAFREHMLGKYGEPIVSELDQLVASIQGHLEDIVQARKSAIKATQSAIDAGLESLEDLVDAHETRLDQHDTRIDSLETAGGGSGNPSMIHHRTFPNATVDGDTVFSFALPSGTLTGDNQAANLHAWGNFANIGAATKQIRLRFNGKVVATVTPGTPGNTSFTFWEGKIHVARVSSTTGRLSGMLTAAGLSPVQTAPQIGADFTSDTITWSSQSPTFAIQFDGASNTTSFLRRLNEVTITKEIA